MSDNLQSTKILIAEYKNIKLKKTRRQKSHFSLFGRSISTMNY